MSKVKGNSDAPATPPADPSAPAEIEFELTLEDTLSQHSRGLTPHGKKGTVVGYNPYDTPNVPVEDRNPRNPGIPPEPKKKPTDLRKLSEWIRLQRQVEALKKQGPEADPGSESDSPESDSGAHK
jgi:hypothetical protein